mmetsp:Transcript_110874/g.220518  ORF Transcript_110874/g.220518 Transcript_110874/m.220518 type:complete len:380 (-) Transcript_110874:20-1159(-)
MTTGMAAGVGQSVFRLFQAAAIFVVSTLAAPEVEQLLPTSSPIIGIFSMPFKPFPGLPNICEHCEVLPASYVKAVEAAGGRVLPISYYADSSEVELLGKSLNGILFTGGGDVSLPLAAKKLLNRSRTLHLMGESLPVWGTCLGFEWLVNFVAQGSLQDGFNAFNVSLPLRLTSSARKSRLLGTAPPTVLDALVNMSVAFNMHHLGIEPSRWEQFAALAETFDVLATSVGPNNRGFVSTIEGIRGLPWFGVQWHPEKNTFEHGLSADGTPFENISHGPEAIAVEQYMSNFFVTEARRSTQSFSNHTAAALRLIYGQRVSTALNPAFVETYVLHYRCTGQAPQTLQCASLIRPSDRTEQPGIAAMPLARQSSGMTPQPVLI